MADEIAPADIEHGADRDKGAEAHALAEAPVEDGGAKRTALTEKGHTSGLRHGGGKGGVQLRVRCHEAEAVRADEAYAAFPRLRQHLLLQCHTFWAGLFKSSRDDDGRPHAAGGAFTDDLRQGDRWRGDNGEIDWQADGAQARPGAIAEHLVMLRIDGVKLTRKGDEVFHQSTPDTAHPFRGTNQGDGLRLKEGLQR